MKSKTNKQSKKELNELKKQLLSDIAGDVRSFNGNKLLKRTGETLPFTKEHIRELKKCKKDPVYFASRYIKIVHVDKGLIPISLYDYQKELINLMKDNRFVICLSARQTGKCHCINSIITVKHKDYNNGEPFDLTVGEFYELLKYDAQKVTDEKFVEQIDLSGWEIKTDTGYEEISHLYKTVKYERYVLKTENHTLECADTHIVFDENMNEVFVKDLNTNDSICTEDGIERVLSVENTKELEHMYDLSVNDENHRYYTNGILSHNTTSTFCFILWYILFHADKNIAILANKGATARMILSRIQLAYTYLPKWLQQGVDEWNKGSIHLENGSAIIAASTSSDNVRGSSFSMIYVDENAFIPRNIWDSFMKSVYPTISSGKETRFFTVSTPNGMNHFYDMWTAAVEKRSEFVPFEVSWDAVPGRDEEWKAKQIRNTSEEMFAQEFGNCIGEDAVVTVRDKITGDVTNVTVKELREMTSA